METDLYYYILDLCDGDKENMKYIITRLGEILDRDDNEYEKIYDEELGQYKVVAK